MHKIWPVVGFCPWDVMTCPCPEEMAETCLGHFQLRQVVCDQDLQSGFLDLKSSISTTKNESFE